MLIFHAIILILLPLFFAIRYAIPLPIIFAMLRYGFMLI